MIELLKNKLKRPLSDLAKRLIVLGLDLFLIISALIVYLNLDKIVARAPECVLYKNLGLYCAGCGTIRLINNLMHGDVLIAISNNALIFLLIICILIYIIVLNISVFTGYKLYGFFHNRFFLILVAAITIVFMVVRNIPVFPFTCLAP